MPTYTFRNKDTNEIFEEILKISELDQFRLDHPELETIITVANTIRGLDQKPDSGFRDVLTRIKSASGRNNTINTF